MFAMVLRLTLLCCVNYHKRVRYTMICHDKMDDFREVLLWAKLSSGVLCFTVEYIYRVAEVFYINKEKKLKKIIKLSSMPSRNTVVKKFQHVGEYQNLPGNQVGYKENK